MSAVVAGICAALCGAGVRADTRAVVIGTSQRGVPLTLYQLGDGAQRVLILGGQHGGPEENTVELASALLANQHSGTAPIPSATGSQGPSPLPTGVGPQVLFVQANGTGDEQLTGTSSARKKDDRDTDFDRP